MRSIVFFLFAAVAVASGELHRSIYFQPNKHFFLFSAIPLQLNDFDHLNKLIDPRISGGHDAKIEDFPYQASLQNEYDHLCGATIISDTIVITAAHCVAHLRSPESEELKIVAGSTTFEGDENAQVRRVAKYVIHPDFHSVGENDVNDICVLFLEQPLEYGKYIQPVSIAYKFDELKVGTEVVVSGWGTETEDDDFFPSILKSVTVNVVSNEKCNESYEGRVTSDMICATADNGRDACMGDCGGPLVYNNKLYGIVAWGRGCGRVDFPGVYMRVSSYLEWIIDVAEAGMGKLRM